MHDKQLYIESLGCARNTVDSETMIGHLESEGWAITNEPSEADTIVVNTCSFIEPAINESIDTILELAKFKKIGTCRRLIVAGCLPERFQKDIVSTLPEVDVFIGTGAFDQIVAAANGDLDASKCLLPDPNLAIIRNIETKRSQRFSHTVYLKIAEGCSRHCTYCIIPNLRGKQRSRPIEAIVSEAKAFIQSGAKEMILVAQDTTAYGEDLTPSVNISMLLNALSALSDNVWFRVLYGHPESITDEFIQTVANRPNICSYFDIPIQHTSSDILKRMGRNYTEQDLYALFDKIRTRVPDAALRTTLITGFPGETERDCRKALDFMKQIRFENLGVFVYSDSEDLPSHGLSEHVDKNTAQKRRDLLMSNQKSISLENNEKVLNRHYAVLVDDVIEQGVYSGRTYFQAPEVDGITYLYSKGSIEKGAFIQAKITDVMEYDLVGEPSWAT